MPESFSRKTKTELMEEYKKLRQELDRVRRTAAEVAEPRSQELLAKTQKQTEEDILQAVQNAKTTLNTHLNQLAEALSGPVNHLKELREAVLIWQKNVEQHMNISVAADALEELINEYDMKKRQFESETAQRRFILESELEARQREWEQAQAEKEYEVKHKRKQQEEEWEEKMKKREKEIAERTEHIQQTEAELKNWQQQVSDFDQRLSEELKRKEQEITDQLSAEHEGLYKKLTYERDAERRIFELQIANAQEQAKQQTLEITNLKKTLEEANRRAQDLAAKVIEGNRPVQMIARQEVEK